jgi:ribosomal 30S subunit maturation factor RimM
MEHGPLQWLVVQRAGQEALLPLNEQVFVRVDRESKRFYLHLSPGMEELYPFLFEG